MSISCGKYEKGLDGPARVQIVAQGISSFPAVTVVNLEGGGGAYTFDANATITAGTTVVTVSISRGAPVTSVTIDIPTGQITGGAVGDSCAGSTQLALVAGQQQTVSIDMSCGGDVPDAAALVDLTFCNNPDVTMFALQPPPPWSPDAPVDVTVDVVDHEPGTAISSVVAEFLGTASSATLSTSGGNRFTGTVNAPSSGGLYTLQITVTDGDCGATTVSKADLQVTSP